MAKLQADEINLILNMDATASEQELHKVNLVTQELEKTNRLLRKSMVDLQKQGKANSTEHKNLKKILSDNNKELNLNKQRYSALTAQMGLTNLSFGALRKIARDLQRQLEGTSQALNPKEYARLETELANVYNRMDELRKGTQIAKKALDAGSSELNRHEEAISDFNKAIEINPRFAEVYFTRGDAYSELNDITSAFKDMNNCLYLILPLDSITSFRGSHIRYILSFYIACPQTFKAIAERFNSYEFSVYNNELTGVLNQLENFTLLLNYYKYVNKTKDAEYRKTQALLFYYLEGAVVSLHIFANLYKNTENISSQVLYYYALSAQSVSLESKRVLQVCTDDLLSQPEKTSVDYYYLGQLYILSENEEVAVENFLKSKDFIFSQIMLAYLTDQQSLDPIPDISTDIEYNIGVEQFANYFHIMECEEAMYFIPDLSEKTNDILNISFWNLFHFTTESKEIVTKLINEKKAQELYKEIHEDFLEIFDKKLLEEISSLKDFFTKKSIPIQTVFRNIEAESEKQNDIENQIGMEIQEGTLPSKLYHKLIQYFYLEKNINAEQVFTLLLFLIKTSKEKDINTIFKLLQNVGTGLMALLGIGAIITTVAVNIIYNILSNEEFDLDEKSTYQRFKEILWTYIAEDKKHMSEEVFARKYYSFDWYKSFR